MIWVFFLEREIDQLVYRLYGLAPEEIKIGEEIKNCKIHTLQGMGRESEVDWADGAADSRPGW